MTSLQSAPVLDVSVYVLRRLDEHLLDLRGLRDQMRVRSTTAPGSRHSLAVTAVALTERFAADLHQALQAQAAHPGTGGPAGSPTA